MDKIINWFILVIIFVFDPLAIALVIAANNAFNKAAHPEQLAIYNEKPIAPVTPPPPVNNSWIPPIFKRKKNDDDVKTY